ncbi:hypothetical protein VTN00DRAFT_6116 [Thermoascus crustaceus]|uniref:uncharacterized protein n=1 Tax=Thermoascus crustaceus TaxID=5088 RepID=UPI0037437A1F
MPGYCKVKPLRHSHKTVEQHYKAALVAPDSISLLASSLRIRLRIFPLAAFGSASTNLTPPASALYLASLPAKNSFTASSVNCWPSLPGRRTTYARGSSLALVARKPDSDHRCVYDLRMRKQHRLELRWSNLKAADFDHLFFPVDDVQLGEPSSKYAMSPVLSHPSASNDSALAASLSKYPEITVGPRTQSSPRTP